MRNYLKKFGSLLLLLITLAVERYGLTMDFMPTSWLLWAVGFTSCLTLWAWVDMLQHGHGWLATKFRKLAGTRESSSADRPVPQEVTEWEALIQPDIEDRQRESWLTGDEIIEILLESDFAKTEAERLKLHINEFVLRCIEKYEDEVDAATDMHYYNRYNEMLFRAWIKKEQAAGG